MTDPRLIPPLLSVSILPQAPMPGSSRDDAFAPPCSPPTLPVVPERTVAPSPAGDTAASRLDPHTLPGFGPPGYPTGQKQRINHYGQLYPYRSPPPLPTSSHP